MRSLRLLRVHRVDTPQRAGTRFLVRFVDQRAGIVMQSEFLSVGVSHQLQWLHIGNGHRDDISRSRFDGPTDFVHVFLQKDKRRGTLIGVMLIVAGCLSVRRLELICIALANIEQVIDLFLSQEVLDNEDIGIVVHKLELPFAARDGRMHCRLALHLGLIRLRRGFVCFAEIVREYVSAVAH